MNNTNVPLSSADEPSATPLISSDPGAVNTSNGENRPTVESTHRSNNSNTSDATVASSHQPSSGILVAEEQVLPTLQRDGKRKWITPSLERGNKWNQRRWTAYALIAFFVILPHLRIQGKPYILLDIASREFTFFGHTFYPTDTPLLALLTFFALGSIMLITSVAGRIWCGWGCPHTVYLEFLFRPIDRLFDGTLGKGGKPRRKPTGAMNVARVLVYLVCCLFLTHTFLSYFVRTDELARWITTPPNQHPVAFLVMAGTTAALMFHFLYFREQLCFIACPYGRFQSVLLDRRSLIVAYDARRGEPRKKGKREPVPNAPKLEIIDPKSLASSAELPQSKGPGDCIDCGRCTAVCPTGIDIRNGLQLECIHCTQCIDACNAVMDKIGQPRGLIRYSSQNGLEGEKFRWLRPRTAIYIGFLTIVGTLFILALMTKFAFDARVLPSGGGAPFIVKPNQTVQNNMRLRLVNRSQHAQTYRIEATTPEIQVLVSDSRIDQLKPGDSVRIPFEAIFPVRMTMGRGQTKAQLKITDSEGATRLLDVKLLGPK